MCSMSSYRNGPWKCGSYVCPKDETCGAVRRNQAEAEWLAHALEVDHLYEHQDAYAVAYGLPDRPRPSAAQARNAVKVR